MIKELVVIIVEIEVVVKFEEEDYECDFLEEEDFYGWIYEYL